MEVHHEHTAAADGVEETGSSFTWESQFLSRVNAHQTHQGMPSLMEGATSIPTECAVTIVKETGVFEKLLMEKLSVYMCPIIGISSLNGWLLVHFWEGDSYAVDLGALSPGSKQGKAHPGAKIAGGTPDNIHKWAIIHSVGRLLSDDSILKVVYDVLHVSHDLGENAGLKIVRVFDVLEADRIIRDHSFLMPLAELLQIYGMVPNSCVDILVGSQRTPVVDDPLDYCGKSQRQAINNLREMAQVSSKMIPFLYQAMLSIMSAPMLAELNQRSNASVQSPQQLDCWYNPRRGDMVSGPENVSSHPSSYAAALEGMAATGNESTQQAPCLVQAIESYTEEAKYDRTEVQKQRVTQNELHQKFQGETQEQHQQGEEIESVEPYITSQKESHGALHLVTSNIRKETTQQPHFDCNAKKMVQSTYANVLQGKAGCLTENAITKQAPPRLTRDEASDIEETSDESIRMHSQDLPPKKQKHQVQKHEHHGNCGSHSQSKEQVNYPQVANAQGEKLTQPSVAASNEKKKQQENSLDKSVRPKTNQSASSVGAVAATSTHQKQQQQPEQLQECIRTLSAKKKKKKKKKKKNNTVEKESPPQLKSNKSGGNVEKEQNQMLPEKMQNDVKSKKSSVTTCGPTCGPANPREQTGPSKSPLSLGVPVGKEKNQLKVKVQNDVKPKESKGIGASGPAKTKEQPKQSKSLLSSKEKEKGKMSQQGVQNDAKRKNNSAPKTKTKEQSNSSKNPCPKDTVKKEQNTLPQQKTQNGVKPKKSSVTSDKTSAKTSKQNSSSKSCPSPGATNKKGQNQMPQPKVQNDKKAEKSSVTPASGPAKAKEQPSRQDKHQQKQQENSEVMNAVKAESKKKTESSQKFSDKPTCVAKTQEQNSSSKSCPSPGATNKKGQNQMPQPKVQNDKKSEKSSVTSASGPAKAKEQPSRQDKHQQKQQENSEVINAVKAESKKKTESSQKFSDKPTCVAKTQEQNSSSKSCPSPGATNKKGQNQMPQPKVQNDKKAEISSEIGACGLANTKDQASSSKNSHTPREVVKKEQSQKSQNDVESKKHTVTPSSIPVKAKEQPFKQDKHQQKQQENSEVNDAVNAESKKKKEPSQKLSDKPALKTEKEHIKSEMTHHRQRPTLFKDCPAEKRESDASTSSSISFTEQEGRQEQKDFPKMIRF
ncbi:serine/arginine repetitive matrix protein 1 [Strongylocentrotus purpuratus]|uniref:Uncharacterized protein n=1 Tax=Strongylocentrotus purpuratus TaxID=7668 RepID=A0A7M7PMR0_STRPU|nr:serine/arginine repetitive matrix protein 1 [Strongylocentrotus purpuratus]